MSFKYKKNLLNFLDKKKNKRTLLTRKHNNPECLKVIIKIIDLQFLQYYINFEKKKK